MDFFVKQNSIVREIWGKSDTVLFIFAGASAEFALNKAVDWLYFTGKLPSDPLKRLFSTVTYARRIVFSETETAQRAIDSMSAIHAGIEAKRAAKIPDWAYRDVLFMLIDYSVRSYEILERKLTEAEKAEVYHVFYRVGTRMGIPGLNKNYREWLVMRKEHLLQDLEKSEYTLHLYKQYKAHLGLFRYLLLTEVQATIVPREVKHLLKLGNSYYLPALLLFYKVLRKFKMEAFLKNLILPAAYKSEIKALDSTLEASNQM